MLPRKSASDAVYCVELLRYTIILHIQLALQDLICIIGSLMKLALWNKKGKKNEERDEKIHYSIIGKPQRVFVVGSCLKKYKNEREKRSLFKGVHEQ